MECRCHCAAGGNTPSAESRNAVLAADTFALPRVEVKPGRQGDLLRVGGELGPDGAVGFAGAGQPLAAGGEERRVEAGEVAGLHGQGAGGAADLRGELDDLGVAAVEAAEGGAHVEAEGDEQLVAGPAEAVGHGLDYAGSGRGRLWRVVGWRVEVWGTTPGGCGRG